MVLLTVTSLLIGRNIKSSFHHTLRLDVNPLVIDSTAKLCVLLNYMQATVLIRVFVKCSILLKEPDVYFRILIKLIVLNHRHTYKDLNILEQLSQDTCPNTMTLSRTLLNPDRYQLYKNTRFGDHYSYIILHPLTKYLVFL